MSLEKIKFIIDNFNTIEDRDPRFDRALVYNVKMKLIEKGFYKKDSPELEFSVTNLILKAQGKYKKKQPKKPNVFV
jgi:hypothetical protein